MKFKNIVLTSVLATAFVSGSAFAGPSAKFAADWKTDNVTLAEAECTSTDEFGCSATDSSTPAEIMAAELMATIKVPQNKELLIGVSGEVRLLTLTESKGKSTDLVTATSSADANLALEVRYAPIGTPGVCTTAPTTDYETAAPGSITFASRKQDLSVNVDLTTLAGGVIAEDIVAAVTVGLSLDTVAAHHFNFVAPNLDSGEYDVWACFSGEAMADVVLEGKAKALVAIQKRMVTVQEVRAVNGEINL